MGKSKILSIIIPVYNAESYIVECLYSILKSVNSQFEIVCIDDGSYDDSESLIKKINDKRIRYFYKSNGGVSSARNFGIDVSEGEYISFVDSDDYVRDGYADTLINHICSEKRDLLLFNHLTCSIDGYHSNEVKKDVKDLKTLYCMACTQRINAPWDKVFKRSIIVSNNIRFDETMKTSEDGKFLIEYLPYVETFGIISQPLYCYRFNPNGAVRSPKISYIYDQAKMYEIVQRFATSKKLHELDNSINEIAIERIFYLAVNLMYQGQQVKSIMNTIRESNYLSMIASGGVSFKGKIKYIILKLGLLKLGAVFIKTR